MSIQVSHLNIPFCLYTHTEIFGIEHEKGLFQAAHVARPIQSLNFCMRGRMMMLTRGTDAILNFIREAEI